MTRTLLPGSGLVACELYFLTLHTHQKQLSGMVVTLCISSKQSGNVIRYHSSSLVDLSVCKSSLYLQQACHLFHELGQCRSADFSARNNFTNLGSFAKSLHSCKIYNSLYHDAIFVELWHLVIKLITRCHNSL